MVIIFYVIRNFSTRIAVVVQAPTIIADYGDFSLSKGRQECSSTTGEIQNESLIHLKECIINDIDSEIFFCYPRLKIQDFYDCGIISPSYIVEGRREVKKYEEIRKKAN